jgi:hypothetical protein
MVAAPEHCVSETDLLEHTGQLKDDTTYNKTGEV